MKDKIKRFKGTYSSCSEFSRTAIEKGKKYQIECTEVYLKARIDDCIITSKSIEKCDFLFIRDSECKESKTEFYFVELKGSDIEKAFNQIIETIKHLTDQLLLKKDLIFGFIVSSKVPSGGNDVTKLKQLFAKKYGKKLEIKNKVLIYKPTP
ncbi:hypothetical protein C1637_03700 [Chryseobacterium lactis]|uniref:Uncharacterized protein n=1 Tax=Chryseobacterium lactis TaxID=1241981 RepID=A0A3G6RTS1_CHRLC|nr:hypothetical protein [Chryseobacterium lactis]AZA81691.1 hypothetical protein EG342_07095 [Chryseobacterium lactis]AZB06689.1 hypothetical protein EG341_23215 [Chryseobacterium lactis]PNW15540.1 hypothetical protein C1637_03700 [Chryseobacterium lactis]